MNETKHEIPAAPPRHRKQKNSHRIRRRRASTGQKFGEIHTAPSSSLSLSVVSPSRSSPVSVCEAPKSSSFDEAFRSGTVLPYVIDSAFRSLQFDMTISLCSSFSVDDDGNDSTKRISDEPQRFFGDDFHTSSSEDGKDDWSDTNSLEPNSASNRNGGDGIVGLLPSLLNPLLHKRDHPARHGNGNDSPHGGDGGFWTLAATRSDPLVHATDPENDNSQDNVALHRRGHSPLSAEATLQSDDSNSNNAPTPGKGSRSGSGSSKGSSTPSSKGNTSMDTSSSSNKRSTTKSSSSELERVHVQHPGADRSALKELPALRDAPPAKREELFILKLKLCSVIFSFDDPMADKRGKDMKRQTLLELVDYVNTPAGQKIFTESVMGDLMAMVSANVCRALPPATDDFDPEEDEPVLEPAWPHLQVAYEFFLRFIVSSEVNAKAAKKYVDQKFCLQLVELFDSEDPRERDYLKTILHRIYGKFMSHRSFIRRAISNVFYRFVYETERHNGIGELLEILGSIINGFAIPLKKEHLQFLVRALIPLHKPKCVALYHQQLSYCIIQYVEKDADTATPILNGFFKCWPWSSSGKQVMFLNELEEILELLGAEQLAQVSDMLFTNLARCLDSDHFQVVERALFLWNNEHLVNSGCLSRLNAQAVLPIIYGPLYKNSSGHWNATVEGLAQNVLKMYMEYDLVLYDRCTASYFRDEEEAKRKLAALEDRWAAIENVASTNKPSIAVN